VNKHEEAKPIDYSAYPTKDMILSASEEAPGELYSFLRGKENQHITDSLCNLKGDICIVLTKSDSLGCFQSIFQFDQERGTKILDQFEELNPFNVKLNDCALPFLKSSRGDQTIRIDFRKFCHGTQ
jgi:hypothetical protein